MDLTQDVGGFQDPDAAAFEDPASDASSDSDCSASASKDNTENTGRWTGTEHRLFLEGLELHGKQWKKIAALIKTRTVVQIRTHAQKYFQKLAKAKQNGFEGEILMDGRSSFTTTSKRKNNKRKVGATRGQTSFSYATDHKDAFDSSSGDEESASATETRSNGNLSIDAGAASKVSDLLGSPSPTSVVELGNSPLGLGTVPLPLSKPVTRQRSAMAAAAAAAAVAPTAAVVSAPHSNPVDDAEGIGSSDEDLLLEQDALSWLVEDDESTLTLGPSTDANAALSGVDGSMTAEDLVLGKQHPHPHPQQPMLSLNSHFGEQPNGQELYRIDLHSQVSALASVPQGASLDAQATKRMRMSSHTFCPTPLSIDQPQSFALELAHDATSLQQTTASLQPPRKSSTPRALDYNHHPQHRAHTHTQQRYQSYQMPHHCSYPEEPFCTETDAFRVSLDVDTFVSGFLDVLSA